MGERFRKRGQVAYGFREGRIIFSIEIANQTVREHGPNLLMPLNEFPKTEILVVKGVNKLAHYLNHSAKLLPVTGELAC